MDSIKVYKGRTGKITDLITGVDDWTGIIAKLYVAASDSSAPVITLDGSIDSVNNKVVFIYTHEATHTLEPKNYVFEIDLYTSDSRFIKTSNKGVFILLPSIKINPNE